MDYRLDTDRCRLTPTGCAGNGKKKLGVFDWYSDLPETREATNLVEVQFKNTRKAYYKNTLDVPLEKGDIIAVEAMPGHDIGEVTLTGKLVLCQIHKYNVLADSPDIKRVYRKVRPIDLEKYEEAKNREHATMIKARQIAESLNLNMKIGDVEFQGDGSKAIFYYIADERVDFRQLIKQLAEEFHIRIEMRQIGARQEAGRIGGIGPCGRTLCCSTWLSAFQSVSTSAARYQDLTINPQKLAGQCAKLKCCMNYELDTYIDALKGFPPRETRLETQDATYFHFKTDVFKRQITYSSTPNMAANLVTLSPEEANEVIAANKRGERPATLAREKSDKENKPQQTDFKDVIGQDSLTRFDKKKKPNRSNSNPHYRSDNRDKRRPEVSAANASETPNAPQTSSNPRPNNNNHRRKHRPKPNNEKKD